MELRFVGRRTCSSVAGVYNRRWRQWYGMADAGAGPGGAHAIVRCRAYRVLCSGYRCFHCPDGYDTFVVFARNALDTGIILRWGPFHFPALGVASAEEALGVISGFEVELRVVSPPRVVLLE